MIMRRLPLEGERAGPSLDSPPNDYAQIERMLDNYGLAYVCTNPEILLANVMQPDPGSDQPHQRLERMLEGYRLLADIYSPRPEHGDRRVNDSYRPPGPRYGGASR